MRITIDFSVSVKNEFVLAKNIPLLLPSKYKYKKRDKLATSLCQTSTEIDHFMKNAAFPIKQKN